MKNDNSDQADILTHPTRIPVEAYLSEDYARAEQDKLWRRVWLQAGRVEEIPDNGDYITFDIKSDSVVILRDGDQIRAFHNVCPHRGRKLVDAPEGARNAQGKRDGFKCGFHGWRFNLEGDNTFIPHAEDWQGALDSSCTSMKPVKLDTWGGWIWINLDPDCESLQTFLGVIPEMLEPYELHNMRYRWRKWGVFNCNWKVAMEAFNETYHVQTTHPEFNQYGQFRGWAKAHGLHSNIGYERPKDMDANQSGKLRIGTEKDPRVATAEMQRYTWENANTNTTQTLVDAAQRLASELPEGTPPTEVLQHWLKTAREVDEARGVVWPTVDPEHASEAGTAWQVFPNFQIGHAVNNMLCYSARPYGDDPDKCIFEAAVYELFPKGAEPKTQWEFCPPTEEAWCYVLSQDFSNMEAVQQGMKSPGFLGPQPNPYMERATVNLHRNLARYMGTGEPVKIQS